jgi:uncharacterized repeat protein (TIGR01451 family)
MNAQILARARTHGLPLLGMNAALLAVLILALIGSPGGASAAPGSTDLALTKSDSPDPVTVGGTLTYTIQVKNLGANDATAVVVTDKLPNDLDFVSASASSGNCQHHAHTVTCDLGTIPSGATATVTIEAKPTKAGTISNTASVTSPDDKTQSNDRDTEATVVKKAISNPSCAAPTIVGTPGDDTIMGTDQADVIASLDGNDTVFGGDKEDLICAGAGGDFVSGGPGADTVIGGTGPDSLFGKGGNDVLKGKGGRDRLRGNLGDDFLNGGRNRDDCKGGAGQDTLRRCP